MVGALLIAMLAFAVPVGPASPSGEPTPVSQVAASPSPPPSPPPSTADASAADRHGLPCATNSDDLAFADALATPVDQISVLAFIGRLARLQPPAQRSLFDAVVAAERDDPSAEGRVFQLCAPEASIAASERALIEITNVWPLAELSEATKVSAFARGLRAAIAARMLGDLVPSALRTSVFAPFVAEDPQIFAVPSDPAASDVCRNGSAPPGAIDPYRPPYPAVARSSGTTGLVTVRVDLDRFGFVTALQIVDTSAPRSPGGDALDRMALFAAAASTYRPGCSGESPMASFYLFHAQFDARR